MLTDTRSQDFVTLKSIDLLILSPRAGLKTDLLNACRTRAQAILCISGQAESVKTSISIKSKYIVTEKLLLSRMFYMYLI